MDGILQSQTTQKRGWFPIFAAVVFLAAALGALLLFSGGEKTVPDVPPPYAANVKLTNIHMITAENFIGSSVTYMEGSVTNAGDKTVTGATVEVVFRNSLNEIVQTEDVPVMVLRSSNPYRDFANLRDVPLASGQSRDFRLVFEHVSADWNQQYPQLRVVELSTR